MASTRETLKTFYDALYAHYGPQHWWPADSALEMMVGAILTQNTNWRNVEKAIENLKKEGLLDPGALSLARPSRLAEVIKPAGYYNVKAARLANLARAIAADFDGDVERFLSGSVETLRERLLTIKGVGLETADSIILYAAEKPTFVIDAYTYRVLVRHGLATPDMGYDELKALFEDNLPADVEFYKEYHALIVAFAKEFCRKKPLCEGCILEGFPRVTEAAW